MLTRSHIGDSGYGPLAEASHHSYWMALTLRDIGPSERHGYHLFIGKIL